MMDVDDNVMALEKLCEVSKMMRSDLQLLVSSCRIKEWVDQMQKELVTLADTATAGRSLTQVHITIHTHRWKTCLCQN